MFFCASRESALFPLMFFAAAWENAESAEVALRVETADPSNASHIFESVWNKDDIFKGGLQKLLSGFFPLSFFEHNDCLLRGGGTPHFR